MIDCNFELTFILKCKLNNSHVFIINLRLEELLTQIIEGKLLLLSVLRYNVLLNN